MHNLDSSIRSFARSCFQYALSTKQDLWFATKDTIPRFMTIPLWIFSAGLEEEFQGRFQAANLEYFYTLIDTVARVIRSKEG